MVYGRQITIVRWGYKQTYNKGALHCRINVTQIGCRCSVHLFQGILNIRIITLKYFLEILHHPVFVGWCPLFGHFPVDLSALKISSPGLLGLPWATHSHLGYAGAAVAPGGPFFGASTMQPWYCDLENHCKYLVNRETTKVNHHFW